MDPHDDRLERALHRVDDATPATPPFEAVVRLAGRRQRVRRLAASGAALALVAVLAAAALLADRGQGETSLDTAGRPPQVEDAATTTAAPPVTTTIAAGPHDVTAPATPSPAPTTTPAPPNTTTTVGPTTTTTPASDRPPPAYVLAKSSGQEVQAAEGSWCWKSEHEAAMCADYAPQPGDPEVPRLAVTGGDVLLVRWATDDAPKSVEVHLTEYGGERRSTKQPCDGGNPCRIAVKLAPGDYEMVVSSAWEQGGVPHRVILQVR